MPIADEVKQELMQVRRDARQLYSQDQVEAAIGKLAIQLTEDYSERFPLFVTIMNGGMIFAGHLLTRLDFPLEMDYLHASRYLGDTRGGDVEWIVTPGASQAPTLCPAEPRQRRWIVLSGSPSMPHCRDTWKLSIVPKARSTF